MKRFYSFVFVQLALATIVFGQSPQPLKKIMELKMPLTADDDMPGTRGAGVAWHPIQKKYYASFAGNIAYPMAVFNAKGDRLSDDTLVTRADTRGLWYNPNTKLLSGNAYEEGGWFTYKLDAKGIPTEATVVVEGENQPGPQSVGAYNPVTRQVLFLSYSQVHVYNSKGEAVDTLTLHLGRKKADGVSPDEDAEAENEDYNSSTVVYTGIKGQELGVLNVTNKWIELYDMKTGFLTKTLSLPENAMVESLFNFAYTNGMYWLFDIELRKWVGYK